MAKCTVCGYTNKDDARFCLNCGAALQDQQSAAEAPDVAEEATVLLDPDAMQKRVERDLQAEQTKASAPPPPPPSPMASAPPPPPPPPFASAPPSPAPSYPPSSGGALFTQEPLGTPPNATTLLVLSILETLCCCMPLGIAGIVLTALAMGDIKAGNYMDAESKLKNARIALIIGAIIGALMSVGWIALSALGAAGGGNY